MILVRRLLSENETKVKRSQIARAKLRKLQLQSSFVENGSIGEHVDVKKIQRGQ
jgi:hypothetical protein